MFSPSSRFYLFCSAHAAARTARRSRERAPLQRSRRFYFRRCGVWLLPSAVCFHLFLRLRRQWGARATRWRNGFAYLLLTRPLFQTKWTWMRSANVRWARVVWRARVRWALNFRNAKEMMIKQSEVIMMRAAAERNGNEAWSESMNGIYESSSK